MTAGTAVPGSNPFGFRRSVSQLRTMRSCGLKWWYQYSQGWRQTTKRGTYAFGDTMQAVADDILCRRTTTGAEAEAGFVARWEPAAAQAELTWTARASWKLLRERGAALAALMATELPARIDVPRVVPARLNERLEFLVGGVPMLGFPDGYFPVQGRGLDGKWLPGYLPTVLDYKTSDRLYDPTAAEIDEQLGLYQEGTLQAGRPVEQLGLCVLIYSAVPQIQWLLVPARDLEARRRLEAGVRMTNAQIVAGAFVQNDRACTTMGKCQFMPLCFGSLAATRDATLTRTGAAGASLEEIDAWGGEEG